MAKPRTDADVEPELDRLFSLPLAEFTAARDALAKTRKAAGDADASARVKALKKPSVPAWAVNRIALAHVDVLKRLLAAGDALRAGKGDVRAAMQARRDAMAAARRAAEEELEKGGHSATPQTMQRVAGTLEALATWGTAPGHPEAGRLTEELSPPGFDELAALGFLPKVAAASTPAPAPLRAVPREVEPERRAAPPPKRAPAKEAPPRAAAEREEARRKEREREEAARREHEAKARELEEARVRLRDAGETLAAARREREKLADALADARKAESAAEAEEKKARAEVARAERAEAAARRAAGGR